MIIRKATNNDCNALSQLLDLYRIFYHQASDVAAAKKFLAERIDAADSLLFVAEYSEKILVGFMQLYPLYSSTRLQRLWLLNDLYILEEFRGKGISRLLIDAAKKIALESQACGLLLETSKSNLIGNKLYPSAGFKLEKDSNFYFWAP